MCGRYALALRPSEVRRQLEDAHMPVEDAPEDDSVRQSYNFAPGYHGLVYRADGPDRGGSAAGIKEEEDQDHEDTNAMKDVDAEAHKGTESSTDIKYKLQAMKWGLIPFWTKRSPDYGSVMKTINCRDDSLLEDRGMWTSMKKKKRCIIVAQGFYEWLKKNNGREKIPHYTVRKDRQLMCFAGLWDCVQYEDTGEKTYTYTIITTNSNKQLSFLHDRMPVILENGSEAIRTWLDPQRTEWSKELQSLLKPFEGELDCYPVSKEVGKVGNNSPSFIIPINSAENKNNIANFFGAQRKAAKARPEQEAVEKRERGVEDSKTTAVKVEHDVEERGATLGKVEGPDEASEPSAVVEGPQSVKRKHSESEDGGDTADGSPRQKRRIGDSSTTSNSPTKEQPPAQQQQQKTRSATSNKSNAKGKAAPAKGDGSRKITSFFGK